MRRKAPETVHGRGLLDRVPRALFDRPIVVTQPEPWALVASSFDPGRIELYMVQSLEHAAALALAERAGAASAVFGIGGGSAVDLAKLIAWKRELPLVLMPTIVSVDAAWCRAVAVREQGRVRYVGSARPDLLMLDAELIQAAPPLLNRAGAGDILSIFTALWDWREAARRCGERWEGELASEAEALLGRLYAGVDDLRTVSERGIALLDELYATEVRLCELAGTSRPEEGSEHYLAYAIEARTGRSFLHGQLVGLGVLVAGRLQGQDLAPAQAFLDRLGMDVRPEALGLRRAEVRDSLLGMHEFLASERQLLPGIFHFRGALEAHAVDRLLDDLA